LSPSQYTHFTLAKALNDIGEYDKSFAQATIANTIQRQRIEYDVKIETMRLNVYKSIFVPEVWGDLWAGVTGWHEEGPIFIVGQPRSGSSLIEQILSSHSMVTGMGENSPFTRMMGELLPLLTSGHTDPNILKEHGKRYVDMMRGQMQLMESEQQCEAGGDCAAPTPTTGTGGDGGRRTVYFVDKMLGNFWNVGFIHLLLPKAKIIHAVRSPLDTCVSCWLAHFETTATLEYVYDLQELGEYQSKYMEMMKWWHKVLPGKVLDVAYEEMVDDTEEQVRRLLDFVGLPWEPEVMRYYESKNAVRTMSVSQVRHSCSYMRL
jgi:hypothetical protein